MSGDGIDSALRRIEALITALDNLPDPAAREPARALLELVLEIHAMGLANMIASIAASDGGAALLRRLAEDEAIRGILLLHGLHPETVETRVGQAVAVLRPQLAAFGLGIKLDPVQRQAGARAGVADWRGAGAGQMRRRGGDKIEAAIVEAAPDLETLEISGLDETVSVLATQCLMAAIAPTHNWVRQLRDFAAPPVQHCEICNGAISPEHAHLVDVVGRRLLCACRACAATASRHDGSLRLPPRRAKVLAGFRMSAAEWDALQIPIDMAFIFHSTADARAIALYSGAGGSDGILIEPGGVVGRHGDRQSRSWFHEAGCGSAAGQSYAGGRGVFYPAHRSLLCVGGGQIRRQLTRRVVRPVRGGSEVWEAIGEFFARLRLETGRKAA